MSDLPAAINKAGSAFPRYSRDLLLPAESISVADLRPSPTLSTGVTWIAAPAPDAAEAAKEAAAAKAAALEAREAAAAEKAAAEEEMMGYGYGDEQMFGDDGADEEDSVDSSTPPPSLLHSVSHLLVIDVCNATHLAVAAGALAALETSPSGRARLGLLHNPADAKCATPTAAAWASLASATTTAAVDFAALRTLLALAHAASLAPGGGIPALTAALKSSLLPSGASAASAATVDLSAHAAYAESLGLGAGDGALVTNGRLVTLTAGTVRDKGDVSLLEE